MDEKRDLDNLLKKKHTDKLDLENSINKYKEITKSELEEYLKKSDVKDRLIEVVSWVNENSDYDLSYNSDFAYSSSEINIESNYYVFNFNICNTSFWRKKVWLEISCHIGNEIASSNRREYWSIYEETFRSERLSRSGLKEKQMMDVLKNFFVNKIDQ